MSHHSITGGIDVGDRNSRLCLLNTVPGEMIEESKVRTSPEAFERYFSRAERMRVAIEAGTHSPWVSRLLECVGHGVLVANRPAASALRCVWVTSKPTEPNGATRGCSQDCDQAEKFSALCVATEYARW